MILKLRPWGAAISFKGDCSILEMPVTAHNPHHSSHHLDMGQTPPQCLEFPSETSEIGRDSTLTEVTHGYSINCMCGQLRGWGNLTQRDFLYLASNFDKN